MESTKNYRVAIDIGYSKVSVLVVNAGDNSGQRPAKVALATESYFADDSQHKSAQIQALATAVRRAEAEAGINIRRAYVSLTDKEVRSFIKKNSVFARDKMQTITADDTEHAIKTASQTEVGADEQVLHIIPRTYYLDSEHAVTNPLGMHSSELSIESLIITSKKEQTAQIRELLRRVHISLDRIIVNQVAVGEVSLSPEQMESGAVVVDIGGGATGIAAFSDGQVSFVTSVPVGGHLCTRDLQARFTTSLQDSELIKVEHGSCLPEQNKSHEEVEIKPAESDETMTMARKDISQVVKARYQELIQIVLYKLQDEPNAGRPNIDIETLVFSGMGASVKDFLTLAKHTSPIKVDMKLPSGFIAGITEDEQTLANATVLGMMAWAIRNLPQPNHVTSQKSETDTRSYESGNLVVRLFRKLFRF